MNPRPAPRLADLPPPPAGRVGWPWTEASPPHPASAPSPRITIVTPSFNQAAYLEETLRSVLLQGYPNLEYIVIDGGSADGSVEILKEYAPWLDHWVSERDAGQSDAINKGLARATGEWFNWINSDDCLLPGALSAVARARPSDASAVVLAAGQLSGASLDSARPAGRTRLAPTLEETIVEHYICQQGLFLRLAAARAEGGVDHALHYVMDWDLLARLLLRHGRDSAHELPETVAFFRRHDAAKTSLAAPLFHEEERARLAHLAARLSLDPRLLERLGPPSRPGTPALATRLVDPARLARLLAHKYWLNGVVEPAWRRRDFALFKHELRAYRAAFPEAGSPRLRRLRLLARLPDAGLRLLSVFRTDNRPARA